MENNRLSEFPDCTGIILAGGWSRRMGRDKATVQWRDEPLIAHVVRALHHVVPTVIAVGREEQPTAGWPVDAVVHDDPALPEGPLRGLAAGLSQCRSPLALVVAGDTPCVQPALLQFLLSRMRPDVSAVIPRWDNHLQVLCGVYRSNLFQRFREFLLQGISAPKQVLPVLKIAEIAGTECKKFDPEGLSFYSVNTVTALHTLESKMPIRPPS